MKPEFAWLPVTNKSMTFLDDTCYLVRGGSIIDEIDLPADACWPVVDICQDGCFTDVWREVYCLDGTPLVIQAVVGNGAESRGER